VDPGTIGATGAREKDITLSMAQELKSALESTGRYKVVLTRTTDVFIPLQERVRISREAGASLFLSLHADSVGSPSISGASIYTLSEQASDKEAEALAAKENGKRQVAFTCIYSFHDNLVAPPSHATLPGARAIAYAGIGHVSLIRDPRVQQQVVIELRRQI